MNDTISRLPSIGTNPPFFSNAMNSLNVASRSTPFNQVLQVRDSSNIVTKLTPKMIIEAFLSSSKDGAINLIEGFRNQMAKLQTSGVIGLQAATSTGGGQVSQQGLYTNFGVGGFADFLRKNSNGESAVFTEQAEAIKSGINIILENPIEAAKSIGGSEGFNVSGRGVISSDKAAQELTEAIKANSSIVQALVQLQPTLDYFIQSQKSKESLGTEQEKLAKQITEKPPGSNGSPS
jgi:hypothetical protein